VTSSILLTCLFTAICAVGPGPSPIRVNEVTAGSAGFVELRNTGNGVADIGGWTLFACSAGGSAPLATLPIGTEIPPGEFFLVVGRDFAGTATRQLVVESVDGGVTVRSDTGSRIDSLGFTTNSPCREGTPSARCNSSSAGRDSTSRDTDDNANDFTCQPATPDQPNEMAPFNIGHISET
jgi:hypothetical protein